MCRDSRSMNLRMGSRAQGLVNSRGWLRTTRNPTRQLAKSGSLDSRLAVRKQLAPPHRQAPPRIARAVPAIGPFGSVTIPCGYS